MISFSRSVLEEESLKPGQAPTADQVKAMGVLGLAFGRTDRIAAVNEIGANLDVPKGGWPHAQSQLFVKDDARLNGVFKEMSNPSAARTIASHLSDSARYTSANIMLTLVTSQREFHPSPTATSSRLVHSFWEGGLDNLWEDKDSLRLPESITIHWKPAPSGKNPDDHTGKPRDIHPANLPARDEVLAYAATTATRFEEFKGKVGSSLRGGAGSALAGLTRINGLVWQAFSFLAHGGNVFNGKESLASQIGQHFGVNTALGYIVHSSGGGAVDLNRVVSDKVLSHNAWVRSAKVRAVETLFLERLFAAVSRLTLFDQ